MKTAISIKDDLLHEADRVAGELGISRSGLVSLAVQEFLSHRRQEQIVAQLNAVYGGEPAVTDKRRLAGMRRKFRSTIRDSW